MDIKVVNLSGNELPKQETDSSAGLDLRSVEEITLKPMGRAIVGTGISIELPTRYEAQIRPRSGLASKKGITVLNSPGTIDADYRGEIGVILINLSNEEQTIEAGERIAQMVVARHEWVNLIAVKKLTETKRGSRGFGSTGKK